MRRPVSGVAPSQRHGESAPGSTGEEATLVYRGWTRNLFTGLAREAGVADPGGCADQLQLLYDGANIGAWNHRDRSAAAARVAAATLLDAATTP